MKKVNVVLTILCLIALAGLLITFGLHQYHNSFDPYSWLDPTREDDYSRYLWNVRKELYRWWFLIFLISTIIFGTVPIFNWLVNRKKSSLK